MKTINIISVYGDHYGREEASLFDNLEELEKALYEEARDCTDNDDEIPDYIINAEFEVFTVDVRAWERFQKKVKEDHGNTIIAFQTYVHSLGVPM